MPDFNDPHPVSAIQYPHFPRNKIIACLITS